MLNILKPTGARNRILKFFILILLSLFFASFCFVPIVEGYHFSGVEEQTIASSGTSCSLVLDSHGNPHVAFIDGSNTIVKYTWWNGSRWLVQNVTSGPSFFRVSLALDFNDNPYVSYAKQTDAAGHTSLGFATRNGSTWFSEIVDVYDGWFSSIAVDSKGNPHISYFGFYSLSYASWNGSRWKIETVDAGDSYQQEIGWFSSLVLDAKDKAHISYYDRKNGDLKYAYQSNTSWVVQTVDSENDVGHDTSLALDSKNNPHISYCGDPYSGIGLKYAVWNGSAWKKEIVDTQKSDRFQLQGSSLALDSHDRPHLSYIDSSGDYFNYATFKNSSWQIYSMDSILHGGYGTSLAIGSHDTVHICHDDYTSDIVKYVTFDPDVLPVPPPPLPTLPPRPTPHPTPSNIPPVNSAYGTIYTVDSSARVGTCCSIALDSKEYPHISYQDISDDGLRYAYWNGAVWNLEIVDSVNWTGWYTSIVLDSDDNPHISYFDNWDNDLKYAAWDGSQWKVEVVDTLGGGLTSIALDSKGNPAVCCYETTNDVLKYVLWNGSAWNKQVIDSSSEFPSLVFDSQGFPHVSYYQWRSGYLKYASWNGQQWLAQNLDYIGSTPGSATSLKLDSNSNAHISYYDMAHRDLKYASQSGSDWVIETVDSAGDVGASSSLALDSHGYPCISYCDNSNHTLKYAAWNGSRWRTFTIDYTGYAVLTPNQRPNGLTGLVLDKNNFARISYFDETNYYLKYFVANVSFSTQVVFPPPNQDSNSSLIFSSPTNWKETSDSTEKSNPSIQQPVPSSSSVTPQTAHSGETTVKPESGPPLSDTPDYVIFAVTVTVLLSVAGTGLFLRWRSKRYFSNNH